MTTLIREVSALLTDKTQIDGNWKAINFHSEDCMSYLIYNKKTLEGIIVDPKKEDQDAYLSEVQKVQNLKIVAVIDTHTHADHISSAPILSEKLDCPLVMHAAAASKKIHLRVSRHTQLMTQAGPIKLFLTPGHTSDSITPIWGPFIFGGDNILYGDSGRDDLPTGDASAHFESLVLIKENVTSDQILLPGHDHKGGRASSWKTQLEVNLSLQQKREEFVPEAEAFKGAAPKLLKEALFENFK